jgi:hypothetical protein
MISSGDESNAKVWIAQIFKSLNSVEAARVAVVLWAIWFACRKAIHEHVFESPLSTHGFIQRFMADLEGISQHRAQGQSKQGKEPAQIQADGRRGWVAPPRGMVKINVDAGLAKNGDKVAAATIARDARIIF